MGKQIIKELPAPNASVAGSGSLQISSPPVVRKTPFLSQLFKASSQSVKKPGCSDGSSERGCKAD
jgi:hypothetical protein